MQMHESITVEAVTAAARESMFGMTDPGFCIECGHEATSGIEPDARGHECENCGEMAVYGADELLFELVP